MSIVRNKLKLVILINYGLSKLFVLVKFVILVFIVTILLPDFTNTNKESFTLFIGLDPSWHVGLQLAYENNLKFGSDIVFTFGPLSYLATKTNIISPNYSFVLFGIFQLFVILFALYEFSIRNKDSLPNFILLLIISLILNPILDFTPFFFIFFSIAFLLHFFNSKKILYLYISYSISLIAFYVKIDSGFPLLILNICAFIPLSFFKINRKKLYLFSIYTIVLLGLSAFFLNVNLPGYIIGGFNMIKGYNVAMYYIIPIEEIFIFKSVILIMLSYGVYFLILIYKSNFNIAEIFKCFILFALLFVFYKKGFTRFSDGNLHYCFLGYLIIASLSILFTGKNKKMKLIPLSLLLAICLIKPQIGKSYSPTKSYYFNNCYKTLSTITDMVKWDLTKTSLKFEFTDFINRDELYDAFSQYKKNQESNAVFRQAFNSLHKNGYVHKRYRKINKHRNFLKFFHLPNRFIQKLKGKTVDIFTMDLHHVYYNKLNYNPRPVFQCYAAYTRYLDNLNASFIANSDKSPEFVLWNGYRAIDNKSGIWESPNTYLNLIENYIYNDVAYSGTKPWVILLEKREKSFKFISKLKKTTKYKINQSFNVPMCKNELTFASIQIEQTLLGKLKSLFLTASPIYAEMVLDNGTTAKHRLIPELINNKIIFNKYVEFNGKEDDFIYMFKNKFSEMTNIKSIKIIADELWYKNEMKIRVFE